MRLTGGEPSLCPDLPDIIAASKATQGIRRVAVTSNGYKLPRVIDDWHSAGLDQLNISIDTLRRDEFAGFTGHDCLARVPEGIERTRALGVKVNAVLLQDGAGRRLAELLAWLRGTPVTLRFIELMRTGDNREYFASNHLREAAVEQQRLRDGWQQLPQTEDTGPAREYAHPDYHGRIGPIMPYSEDCCDSCNRLRVSAHFAGHRSEHAQRGIGFTRN